MKELSVSFTPQAQDASIAQLDEDYQKLRAGLIRQRYFGPLGEAVKTTPDITELYMRPTVNIQEQLWFSQHSSSPWGKMEEPIWWDWFQAEMKLAISSIKCQEACWILCEPFTALDRATSISEPLRLTRAQLLASCQLLTRDPFAKITDEMLQLFELEGIVPSPSSAARSRL